MNNLWMTLFGEICENGGGGGGSMMGEKEEGRVEGEGKVIRSQLLDVESAKKRAFQKEGKGIFMDFQKLWNKILYISASPVWVCDLFLY